MYNETTHAPFNPQNTMVPDTPVSDLSDLDSRSRRSQVYSAGSHLTNASGIYGDFEDDLISTGSVNEDEFIYVNEIEEGIKIYIELLNRVIV